MFKKVVPLSVAVAAALFVVVAVGQDAVNVPNAPVGISPKLSAFQESDAVKDAAAPESTVTITVGEENGFAYTVNGNTPTIYKISVSGEYFNDEPNRYGYARLFLDVDTGVYYYELRPRGNILDVYVENRYGAPFYFEIISPFPILARDLYEGQINRTAILITGPSRSSLNYNRPVRLSEVVQTPEDVKQRRRRASERKR